MSSGVIGLPSTSGIGIGRQMSGVGGGGARGWGLICRGWDGEGRGEVGEPDGGGGAKT